MKELNPAKVAVSSFLFLVVLYLTSALDWAVTAVFISLVVLFNLEAAWLFIAAFVAFLLYLIFIFLNLKIDYILDLSIASYALFAAGIIFYFREGQREKWQLILPFVQKINITRIDLLKIGGILLFTFLIYPLTNAFLAAIIGYIAFLVIFQKSDGRYAFGIALFFLILCPFLLIAKKDKIAETSAIFTYYFLVVGVAQEIISLIKEPRMEEEVERPQAVKLESHKEEEEPIPQFLTGEGVIEVKKREIKFPRISSPKIPPRLLFGLVSFAISFILLYFLIPRLPKVNLAFSLPKVRLPKISLFKKPPLPSPSPSPSLVPSSAVTPTPVIKVATESAKLKIFVQNGTEINGLAASTAAKLKKVGFAAIEIGNAERQDYSNWELAVKDKKEDLSDLFKNILELTDLKSSEATIPAGFDVLVIAGEKK